MIQKDMVKKKNMNKEGGLGFQGVQNQVAKIRKLSLSKVMHLMQA